MATATRTRDRVIARREGQAERIGSTMTYVSPLATADPANVNENLQGYYKIIRDKNGKQSFKGFDKFEEWKTRTLAKIVKKAAAKGWEPPQLARMAGVGEGTVKRAIALDSRLIRADTIWRLGVTVGVDMDGIS